MYPSLGIPGLSDDNCQQHNPCNYRYPLCGCSSNTISCCIKHFAKIEIMLCFTSLAELPYYYTCNKAILSTSVITAKKFSSHNKWCWQITILSYLKVYISEYVARPLLKLVPPPVEKQTCSEDHRNVFSLRWRMKHFTLNLLSEL